MTNEIIGVSQVWLSQLQCNGLALRKANTIQDCPNRPVQNEFGLLPSGQHFREPVMRPEEHKVCLLSVTIDSAGY